VSWKQKGYKHKAYLSASIQELNLTCNVDEASPLLKIAMDVCGSKNEKKERRLTLSAGKHGLLFDTCNRFFFFYFLVWLGSVWAFPFHTALWATLCATISKTVFHDEERLAMGMVLGIVYLVSNGDIKVG